MTSATRKGNVGLYEGAVDGEDGWGIEMNDNLRRLDLLVAPRVVSIGTNTPPGSPADGDSYVLGAAPTGLWDTHANKIARWWDTGAVWEFITPLEGWRVYDLGTDRYYKFSGSAWLGSEVFDAYCFALSTPPANAILIRIPVVRAITFPANFAGSYGTAEVAATGSTAFSIKKNGSAVGTATFAAAATTCTFTSSGGTEVSFIAGDILSITAPASPDATLSDVGFGITGIR